MEETAESPPPSGKKRRSSGGKKAAARKASSAAVHGKLGPVLKGKVFSAHLVDVAARLTTSRLTTLAHATCLGASSECVRSISRSTSQTPRIKMLQDPQRGFSHQHLCFQHSKIALGQQCFLDCILAAPEACWQAHVALTGMLAGQISLCLL